jgi:hypothetical protein
VKPSTPLPCISIQDQTGGRTPAVRQSRIRLVGWLLLATSVVLLGAPRVQAATYKWTDEKGVVHYTDKIPPEALNKGNVELNKQGVTVKRTDPALTPEQRRAR